ncbi:MAG: tRNA epoxyqueuosine(34) reductase QueG, partial [Deltaproteobacteria bacterium]|nr:tRNA epoxyqueuosine(34) reductase QueG [Deltaproteobacteria bacterium]
NVLIAAGNSGRKELAPWIEKKLKDPSPLVRAHGVWAYNRLLGKESKPFLITMMEQEKEPMVLKEFKSIFQKE